MPTGCQIVVHALDGYFRSFHLIEFKKKTYKKCGQEIGLNFELMNLKILKTKNAKDKFKVSLKKRLSDKIIVKKVNVLNWKILNIFRYFAEWPECKVQCNYPQTHQAARFGVFADSKKGELLIFIR